MAEERTSVEVEVLTTRLVRALGALKVVTIVVKNVTSSMSVQNQERTRHSWVEKLEVPLNSSSSNNLDIIKLQKENEELVKFNDDFRKTFEKVIKEKRFLEQEHVKSNERIHELEREVKTLKHCKEVVEPCKRCEILTLEVNSLNDKVSKLQKESLGFSIYKKITNDLEEIISHQKVSQDKGGLGFFKQGKITPVS